MNELLQQFHFLRPWWFLALIPALLCVLALWHGRRQDQQLARVFNPTFLPFLIDKAQIEHKKWPLGGLFALWLLAVIALAGPTWQKVPQPVERNTEALVVLWDLSPSMLAPDLTPSRLVRSRLKLIDLLQSRSDGQAALVAYAGEAHTVTPLTDDYQTIINLLPALSPSTLPSVGSNAEMALVEAIELLEDAGIARGNILFLTDGIAAEAFDTLARSLRETPHSLSIWGVGTSEGAPIPLPNGGFAKDNRGETVIAKLNEDELQQFASRLGANYVPLQTTDGDIQTLEQLLKPQVGQTERSERTFDQWFEHGQYLALLLLPFVAWVFRRGWVFSLFFIISAGALAPRQVQALEWEQLWLNQDQRAQKRLEQGDAQAAEEFTTHDRRGAALYRNEAYAEAAREFAAGETAEDAYNRGNALTRAGEYEEATAAYDHALELNPELTKARENRAIAQQLAQLQQQSQDQAGDQQQQGDQGQQEDGQNQQSEQPGEQAGEQTGEGNQSQGEPGQANEDQSQSPADAGQQEQMSDAQAQQPEGEEPQAGQNPYSQAEQVTDPEQTPEQTAAQAQEEGEQPSQEQQLGLSASPAPEGQTEEEQKLEQWLRKVPDDPSGLMRNKFKYQHMQRQRQLDAPSPYSDNQAQQRW